MEPYRRKVNPLKTRITAMALALMVAVLSSCSVISGPIDGPVDGGRNEYWDPNCRENIESEEMTSFYLSRDGEYSLKAEVQDDGKIRVNSLGGNEYERDGTRFTLDYVTADGELMEKLQALVKEYSLSKDNGHTETVGGLPFGIGETVSVEYESGEYIYRSSNQSRILDDEEAWMFYALFREDARANGYDFTTEDSQFFYDDADEEFLQGTWTGKHFGTDVEVTFTGNHVVIVYGGEVTDDVDYVIIEGSIRPDILRDEPAGNRPEDDYEKFNGIESMRKAYDFMLTAYSMRGGAYSTFELLRKKD